MIVFQHLEHFAMTSVCGHAKTRTGLINKSIDYQRVCGWASRYPYQTRRHCRMPGRRRVIGRFLAAGPSGISSPRCILIPAGGCGAAAASAARGGQAGPPPNTARRPPSRNTPASQIRQTIHTGPPTQSHRSTSRAGWSRAVLSAHLPLDVAGVLTPARCRCGEGVISLTSRSMSRASFL